MYYSSIYAILFVLFIISFTIYYIFLKYMNKKKYYYYSILNILFLIMFCFFILQGIFYYVSVYNINK